MPELPDLIHVARRLGATLVGRKVVGGRVGDPTPLRLLSGEPFPACLVGQGLNAVARVGQYLRFDFGDRLLVVNAMLVGKYVLASGAPARDPVSLVFALGFDDGSELRYLDDKRMGKIYVARRDQEAEVPGYRDLGVDVLSDDLTPDRFAALVRKRRDQVRNFLLDKKALAAIGNAYADEILFDARIHPKTFCHQLAPDDVARLHASVRDVLRRATDEIARRDPPVDEKLRDFLLVRGRAGKPCPRCSTTLRAVRVGAGDADFCPKCQPAARSLFIDWSRLPPR